MICKVDTLHVLSDQKSDKSQHTGSSNILFQNDYELSTTTTSVSDETGGPTSRYNDSIE